MAQRQLPRGNVQEERDEVVIDGDFSDITDLEADIDEQVKIVIGEHGGGEHDKEIMLKYYRAKPGKGRMAWLFNAVPDELPVMERLRDVYGTGDYAVRIMINNQLAKIKRFSIEAPPNKEPERQPESTGSVAEIMQVIQAQQLQFFNQLRDTFAQTSGRNTSENNLDNMTSLIHALGELKNFITPAQSVNQMDNFTSLIRTVKELMPENRSGEKNIYDVIESVLNSGAFGSAIAALGNQQQAVPAIGHQPKPGGQPTGQPQPGQQGEQNVNIVQDQIIRQQINVLLGKAKRDADPSLYADLILDEVQPEIIQQHLLGEAALAKAIELVPEVANYKRWFIQLQNALKESMSYSDETADDFDSPIQAPAANDEQSSVGIIIPEGDVSPDGNTDGQ